MAALGAPHTDIAAMGLQQGACAMRFIGNASRPRPLPQASS